ncbi:peroxiredoxin family protein [Rubinisphaera margarita]|uniref:peroxiredoxin family protein n=1 Tax=Rubinisphaera margarita TaxID=2909586 RepID=UPI001EE8913E|nr:redoxin domain-containing protein [Rubinisphaera margarita]MCG6155122.1 peroxiredoxin family protein [Rubinisphaera margarita]
MSCRVLRIMLAVCLPIAPLLGGCSEPETPPPATTYSYSSDSDYGNDYYNVTPENIVFKDELASNTTPPQGLDDLQFVDTDGNPVLLKDVLGEKNVVLIFTQGFYGTLCPFCTTQTARLIANYDKFKELETEILVVYPGPRDHLDEFIKVAQTDSKAQMDRVPFPILLDEEFKAVDFFDIRSQNAHPSTYVIDKQGNVLLAYVGKDHTADRPSVKKILESLKAAQD